MEEEIQQSGFSEPIEVTLSPQRRISAIANAIVFLVGFSGLLGIAFGLPRLYFWGLGQTAMTNDAAISLVILSIGYAFQSIPRFSQKRFSKGISILCFGIVLIYALSEIFTFIVSGNEVTLKELTEPISPFKGLSFYAALGLAFASSSSFLICVACTKRQWGNWTIQILGILLVSLTAFGFAENIAATPIAKFFTSIPTSVALFCYGIALLFYPVSRLHLIAPFFSTKLTRFYTFLVCATWLIVSIWQAYWVNSYLGIYHLSVAKPNTAIVFHELLDVLLLSIILGIGLHILGTLDQNTRLMKAYRESERKLEEAFNSYALLAATLSHDLKGPIRTQMNIIEMLLEGQFGEKITEAEPKLMLMSILESNQYELDLVRTYAG